MTVTQRLLQHIVRRLPPGFINTVMVVGGLSRNDYYRRVVMRAVAAAATKVEVGSGVAAADRQAIVELVRPAGIATAELSVAYGAALHVWARPNPM